MNTVTVLHPSSLFSSRHLLSAEDFNRAVSVGTTHHRTAAFQHRFHKTSGEKL